MAQAHEAFTALVTAGFDDETALRCLEELTSAGFLVTKPQHLLDNVVDAALAAARTNR